MRASSVVKRQLMGAPRVLRWFFPGGSLAAHGFHIRDAAQFGKLVGLQQIGDDDVTLLFEFVATLVHC